MKRLLFLMICFVLLSGCSSVGKNLSTPCQDPMPPAIVMLDIGALEKENLMLIAYNMSELIEYIERLHAQVKCLKEARK